MKISKFRKCVKETKLKMCVLALRSFRSLNKHTLATVKTLVSRFTTKAMACIAVTYNSLAVCRAFV